MTMKEVQTAKTRMDEVIARLDEEFGGIHTGRASTTLVEKVMVSSYGAQVPLKSIATISVPESNQIAIMPWDKGQLVQIEAAIRESDLSASAVNDGTAIRVTFPAMTAERRESLVKELHKIAEEARVAMRNVRHELLEVVKKDPASTEDDKFDAIKQFDRLIEEYNGKADDLVKSKEEEIRKV